MLPIPIARTIGIRKTNAAAGVKIDVVEVGVEVGSASIEVKSASIRRVRPVDIERTDMAGNRRANAGEIGGIDVANTEGISGVGIEGTDADGVGKASMAGVGRANTLGAKKVGQSGLVEQERWKSGIMVGGGAGGGGVVRDSEEGKQRKKSAKSHNSAWDHERSHAGNSPPRLSFPPPPFAVLLDGA